MNRVLVLEVDGVLRPSDEASATDAARWLHILEQVLLPWADVQIVAMTSGPNVPDKAELALLFGALAPRLIGTFHGTPRRSNVEASVTYMPPVRSLVLVVDDSDLKGSKLHVLRCDPLLGISAIETRDALNDWLVRTAPFEATSSDAAASSHLRQPYIPASPPKTADIVLYLDLDGVVQHESVLFHPKRGVYMNPALNQERRLFEWVSILVKILEPYPEVRLVLSSSWCVRPGYARTLKRLPADLSWRFIGGTYHKRIHGADPWTKETFLRTPRGVQILADVNRRKPQHWIALDDDLDGWPSEAMENLIACNGSTGLSDVFTQNALKERLCTILPR